MELLHEDLTLTCPVSSGELEVNVWDYIGVPGPPTAERRLPTLPPSH